MSRLRNGYDGPGNLTSVTDQAGNQVQYTYDAANQLKSVIQVNSPNAPNNATVYGYDVDGNLISLSDANDHTTSNSYDLLYELTTKTLPDGASTETRSYDLAGNLLSLKHFKGDTTTYAYDDLNRLTTRAPDPTTGEPTVSFTYTPTGKRHTMTDASGTTQYTYDSLDRLTQKVTPEGTLNYSYDAAGNLASMGSADGNVSVAYNWNALNQLTSVVDSRLGTTTYTYDTANNVVTVAYPNGVQSTLKYDTLNRLTSLVTPTTGYLYQLGPTGNRTNVTEVTGRSINWSYDNVYRLTSEAISSAPSKANGSVSYGLDPVGNRLTTTSTITGINSGSLSFNPDDQVLIESYDADGNTTATGGKSFAYDSEDRLKSMNGGQVTITYDGDGNRVAKTVNGATTHYLVDDLNPTGYPQVVEETGATQRTYTYGLQRISEYQVINNAWTPSFYGYDGMGSVRQLTNAAGATTDTYEYDAFGNELNSTGTTPNEVLYRGEQYDSDLGLYYLRARYYNPLTGRFMRRDPKEFCNCLLQNPVSLHAYLYASDDPVDRLDPTGSADTAEDINISELDFESVGKKTIPKGRFWGGIGLTGVGLEVACMIYTEGAGVDVVGQNIGGLQDPKLLYKICSAISSKVPGTDIGPYPAPFYPDANWATQPGNPWQCEANSEGRVTFCKRRCPNGGEEWFTWDDGTKTGENPHWDYHRCDNTTCKIYTDGTSTCPPE